MARSLRLRSAPLAAATAVLLLALLCAWQLVQAFRLGHELQRGRAEHALLQLAPLLASGSDSELQARVAALVRDPVLGLTYLSVVGLRGDVLAVSGRFDGWQPRWLPDAVAGRLRRAAYAATGQAARYPLQAQGAGVGHADYAVAPALAARVHDSAVAALCGFALGGLMLCALAGLAGYRIWRRAPRSSGAMLRRLDPGRSSLDTPFSASEIEARVTGDLQQRAGRLLDGLERGVLVIDREARIRYINAVAERLTGWGAEDVQGMLVYSVFHPLDERYSPMLTPAEIALREARSYPATELRLRARDGMQRFIEVMAAPLAVAGGSVDGAVMIFHDIAEREARVESLRRQARLSQGVIEHLVEGVLTTDPAGVVRFANARALRMFGYGREELGGVTISKLMPVPFLNSPSVRLTDYVASERASGLPKVVGWRRDATTFPVELVVQPMTIDQSEGLLVIVRDITDRLRSENLAQRLGRLLDAAAEEVYIFDAQSLHFVEVNRGARRNLGYHPSEMARMSPATISQELDPDTFQNYLTRLRSGEVDHVTYRCRHLRADGTQYPVEVRLHFSREEEPPVFMAIAVDITERELAEQRLRYMAHHDALTGLPNRATLQDRLRQAVLAASRSSRQVGVMFMDVDKFKSYNDSYGHEVGDAVLKQVAGRLAAVLRSSDTVARLGGDEFVVVASGLRGIDDAVALARKIQAAFERPLDIPAHRLTVSLSIGIATYPLDESDADGLLHHADTAMYQAKKAGSGQYRFYSIDVPPEKRRRLDLERGIHAAVALNQFRLEFAPILDAAGGLRGACAELHWLHPQHGRVQAAEALASASRAGLQADLELWRLYVATSPPIDGRALHSSVIVEVSGWQLRDPDFGTHVGDLIARNALPAERLVLATDAEGLWEAKHTSHEALHRLFEHGLRFALHDRADRLFAALNRGGLPPLDLIMLDAADVGDVPHNGPAQQALMRALQVARGMEVPIYAPGVATAEARRWLELQGCSLFSGPALRASMSPQAFAEWAESQPGPPL